MTSDIAELPVLYRDACAGDLGLSLDLPAQPALVTRQVELGRWSVELRILGASHQVLIARDGEALCSETVACHLDPDPSRPVLPNQLRRAAPGADYTFECRIERLEPSRFRRRVDELLASLAGAVSALCARFPGDELATTGLRLETTGAGEELSWSGWHSYPRSGEVVTTSSRLVIHAPSPGRLRR
jgi:hypothetical protein